MIALKENACGTLAFYPTSDNHERCLEAIIALKRDTDSVPKQQRFKSSPYDISLAALLFAQHPDLEYHHWERL